MRFWIFLFLPPLLPWTSFAHPVAFQGSLSLTTLNQPVMTENIASYSYHYRSSIGLSHVKLRDSLQSQNYILPRVAFLLKRINQKHSQANLYAWLGYGASESDGQWNPSELIGYQADFETRSFYIANRTQFLFQNLNYDFAWTNFRVGIAPYLANSNELHTFFVVQTSYRPELENQWMVTPLLRMFYKSVLWEIGASLDGDWIINLMIHI